MLELGGIIILGILAQWVAWRFKIPAILPLILIGILVGPLSAEFFSEDQTKWIEPMWNGSKGLFPGESLFNFVSLSISIILFEGGLTLKMSEIKNVAPSISKLITLGSLVTFIGAAIASFYLIQLSWEMSFLFSALIIVTGPTVITPILRNIPLKKDVSAILKWEGILIDPIGALVSVLVFEFIIVEGGGEFTKTAFIEFSKVVLFGSTFGFTFAHALNFAMNKKWIPLYLLNIFSLASVLGVFMLADSFAHESGLLAVVVMGMVLGNSNSRYLKGLLYFKESLSLLLISILFILLSANMNMSDLLLIYNWNTLILFAIIIFVIRPLGVFLCTWDSGLKINEKLFISWVGPRGIVAAGIASLFGLKLAREGFEGAEYITPLVFTIVLGTVLLNATTARFFAKILGVFLTKSEGVLIIGASNFSRLIAQYLKINNRDVVLIDNNQSNIDKSKQLGLEAINTDIYSDTLTDNIELNDMGYLMALTGNADINKYVLKKLGKQFGENGSFRLVADEEKNNLKGKLKKALFSDNNDFIALTETARKFPEIYEVNIKSKDHFKQLMTRANNNSNCIPVFFKNPKGDIEVFSSSNNNFKKVDKNWKLVILGDPMLKK